MTFFDPENKEKIVSLFLDNLLWGTIEIDYERFGSKLGVEYANELYKRIQRCQGWLVCPDDDPNALNETIYWLYDAYIKGRVFGAIKGELRNKQYEDKIFGLKQQIQKLKADNKSLKSENIMLVNELEDRKHIIASYESSSYRRDDNST